MTLVQLRDYPDEAELARIYATPHNHHRFRDHELRVDLTVDVGRWLGPWDTIADLSCGNATIPDRIAYSGTTRYLGDFAPGYEYRGPLETTLDMIPHVQLYVCSETLEHVKDPPAVLHQIRGKAGTLLLSTPIGETKPTDNPEHVWGWDVDDIATLLQETGWTQTLVCLPLRLPGWRYDYQIWAVR